MAISGHKDIRMLQRYSHTNEEAKKEAIKKIGKRFDKLESPRKEGIKDAGIGL